MSSRTMEDATEEILLALRACYVRCPDGMLTTEGIDLWAAVFEAAGMTPEQVMPAAVQAMNASRFFPTPGDIVASWRAVQPTEEERQARFRELAGKYRDRCLDETDGETRTECLSFILSSAISEGFDSHRVAMKGAQAAEDVRAMRAERQAAGNV